MDGRPDACAHCGVPLIAAGRFCSNCGAPVAQVRLQPVPPAATTPGSGAPDEVDPYESLYAEPAPAGATARPVEQPVEQPVERPLFVDQPAVPPGRPPGNPPLLPPALPVAEPLPPAPVPTGGSPGPGLWIGAAVLLVAVLVLGIFLLLHGSGGGAPSSSPTPALVPKQHHTSQAASSATSASPSSGSPSAAGALEVAGLAQASAPRHAPAAVDFAGRPVTYVAPNMVDGRPDTCWRVAGDATGMTLTFRLAQPTTLTRVGLVNGYDKIAFSGGRSFDWYAGNRRVLSVDWVFDDGTTVSQQLGFSRTMQPLTVDPVKTRTVRLRITSVSAPGQGPAARNDTAISEVSLRGTTG